MKRYKFTYAIMIIILVFLLIPVSDSSTPSKSIVCADKIVHFGMFFVLMAVHVIERRTSEKIWKMALLFVGFAFLTEVLQKMTGYRSFDMLDFLSDSVGLIVGCILTMRILQITKRGDN